MDDRALRSAISVAIAGLYRQFYGHDRTTATTYLNDNIVLCVLEDILTTAESRLVTFGDSQGVIAGRVAFQTETQDAFTAAIEDLTGRRVVAFLSANQTTPGCACELFFLNRAARGRGRRGRGLPMSRTAISDAVTATSPVLRDEELMRRVQADDADAFEALYDRYASRAFGLAIVICHESQRAEEAVQDAFLCVWRNRAQYDPAHSPVATWLFALIRNRSIDIYRHNRHANGLRASEAHLDRIAMLGPVEDDVVKRDDGDRLRATLHDLPAAQREVIALSYFGGLTHTEIAERLDVPLGTVKGRMRLGLEKARTEIVFEDNHNRS